jgi:hypothetical protein
VAKDVMASSQPLPDTLAEDLNEIKTYLKTQDHLCASTIQAFLVRYDVLGKAALIRLSSALFNDSDLLEALLDNWEGLLDPVTFVKFIYSFCLIRTHSTFTPKGEIGQFCAFAGRFGANAPLPRLGAHQGTRNPIHHI